MAILIPGYKKSFKFHPLPLPYRPANWNCTHPPSSGSARPPARVLASGARHPSRSLSPFVCWPNRHILCQMPFDLDGGVRSVHWQAWSAPLRPPSCACPPPCPPTFVSARPSATKGQLKMRSKKIQHSYIVLCPVPPAPPLPLPLFLPYALPPSIASP